MSDIIQIYAELLHNIRAITLVITLQSLLNAETKVAISADGQSVSVHHDGQNSSINLPTQVASGAATTLSLPAVSSQNMTFRLQLPEKKFDSSLLEGLHDGNDIPWSASELSNVSFVCKSCRACLLEPERIHDWKNLPNDNWAEMMDLWHCHKPHEEESQKAPEDSKGYSATNQLQVSPGIGFVSLLYVLLSEQDWQNIKVTSSKVQCQSCNHHLGSIDSATSAIKLSKWALAIRRQTDFQDHKAERWFVAQLLAVIDSEGSRRFMVEKEKSEDDVPKAFLCWAFTDDLQFSSSTRTGAREDPTRAMKILWKEVKDVDESLKLAHMSVEHILTPVTVFTEVWQALIDSAELLPTTIRSFQDWQVGLLERFMCS